MLLATAVRACAVANPVALTTRLGGVPGAFGQPNPRGPVPVRRRTPGTAGFVIACWLCPSERREVSAEISPERLQCRQRRHSGGFRAQHPGAEPSAGIPCRFQAAPLLR